MATKKIFSTIVHIIAPIILGSTILGGTIGAITHFASNKAY